PVRVGMPVQQADKLVTGADGTVGVTFTDNSLLSVGPNSVLAIDRYVFDSTTHAGKFDSTLSKGTLAVVSGKMVKQSPEAMHVRTPAAIMGVRGTDFVVRVSDHRCRSSSSRSCLRLPSSPRRRSRAGRCCSSPSAMWAPWSAAGAERG